jgi:N-acetylmuramoyl-L-alanine amidase
MPSVLVELGYLSNSTEEAFLKSEKGQTYLASAIYRAIKEYKIDYEKENGVYEYRKEAVDSHNNSKNTVSDAKVNQNTKVSPVVKKDNADLIYRVQFYTSPKKLKLNDKRFKGLSDIVVYEHNGVFKYTSGASDSYAGGEKHKKTVRNAGFKDAFTVVFYKGMRVSRAEAKKILNEK